MKKWTRTCICIIIALLLGTIICLLIINNLSNKKNKEYVVEINRAMALFDSENRTYNDEKLIIDSIEKLDIERDYIKEVYYYCGNSNDKIEDVLNGDIVANASYMVKKTGNIYVLFTYTTENESLKESAVLLVCLYSILVIAFVVLIFVYVRNSILKPFNQLQEMPLELAKGNLSLDVKENKNKHFGKFVWGLNMLKDTLYSNRKKEYELQKEKKMMILTISHDIKTPLSSINLYATALEDDLYDTNRTKEFAAKIIKNTAVINSFVEDIVKYSKEDIISIEVHNKEFYLLDLIKKVDNQYKEKMNIMQTKLEIIDCPNPLLYGDIDRLFEAISNILENALKYGDRRIMRISFASEDYCQIIKISNSGSDIPNDEINHVFESFWRGKNAIGKEGDGLGLFISREILRKMDGEVFISKEEDLLTFNLVLKRS